MERAIRWRATDAPSSARGRRAALVALFAFVGLNALGGGVYGLSGAPAVPVAWLAGSPFHSYLAPSLVLVLGVGGSSFVAAFAVLAQTPRARAIASAAAWVLLAWIAIVLAILGYVSWMQPATAAAGAIELARAWSLPRGRKPR